MDNNHSLENSNQDQQLILDFIKFTNQPIFLTGKAGTGKTTLLRKIKETTTKNFAVVAPTVVAAINAGGVTIHSFFQMPFGPIIPIQQGEPAKELKYAEDKIKLLKCLEILVIDEISMVRADMLDFIDQTLRTVKASNLPFGGTQVLMIGDLYQLSPIAHDAWHILKDYYLSPYFFDSLILKRISLVTFELQKVYRQSDPLFLDILNRIRENTLTPALLNQLNEHYDPTLADAWKEDYITLTTHNNLVGQINTECLEKLEGETHAFAAKVTGDFPKDAYPVDDVLHLKVGAQVMFIKNDSSGKKLYYNGKAAKVVGIGNDSIRVQFLDDSQAFEVEREEWQNVKYALDQEENKINETNTGSFAQYPFKLAWAITIHKSQGLTFEKAIVDISASFTHGQAYVALSRCKSLDGLLLKSPVKMENIMTDKRIIAFTAQAVSKKPSLNDLSTFQKQYAWNLIDDLFDFSAIQGYWEILKTSKFRANDENAALDNLRNAVGDVLEKDLIRIARKFKDQEFAKVAKDSNLENDESFLARLTKAAQYFIPKLETVTNEMSKFATLNIYLDEQSEKILATLSFCANALNVKLALFNFSWSPFSLEDYTKIYLGAANKFDQRPKKTTQVKTELPKEVINKKLYQSLIDWRKNLSQQRNVPAHSILSDLALLNIAAKPPRSADQLAAIKGVGIGNAVDLGKEILKIVNDFLGASTLF
ncbi:helicase-like protein [Pedobacter psychrotolerans]|uniref:Helicase n=1 Tax=Pedobacter psychrotolerans TaxID=1843235 RepID=A0A4R2H2A2_9SPHI|nr:HRDC domain-containing protein [Pedobacter psychrotolerans]TCO18712.1 helicase-like protein [Pedobacter psychrotolerans]GGE70207.1 helicase [Pedobacter psychrotolerans]